MLLAQLKDADARGADLAFLQNDFSFEPYALVLPRDDPDFRLAREPHARGSLQVGRDRPDLHPLARALGRPGPLLNAMFYLNALPE